MPCPVCGKQMVWSVLTTKWVCPNLVNHNFEAYYVPTDPMDAMQCEGCQ